MPFSHTGALRTILIFLIAFCTGIQLVLKHRENNTTSWKTIMRRTPIDYWLIGFSLWVAISLVTAADFTYSWQQLFKKVGMYGLLYYGIVYSIRQINQIKFVLLGLLIGSIPISLYGIIQFIILHGNLFTGNVRISSVCADYNFLSIYLLLIIPFIFIQTRIKLGKLWQSIAIIGFILGLVTQFLTYSRAGWVAIIAQFLLYGIIRSRKILYVTVAVLLLILILLPLTLWQHPIPATLSGQKQGLEDTFLVRLHLWQFAVSAIAQHPLTGIGFGMENYLHYYPQGLDADSGVPMVHCHNVFLDTALQIGIPGAVILLGLWITFAITFWKGYRRETNPFIKELFLVTLIALFGFFLRNIVDYIFRGEAALLFWYLMAVGIAGYVNKIEEPSQN
ncbi:MAG: O-antigen ligase family protein [bacterium]